MNQPHIVINYRNYRGERSLRRIVPTGVPYFGTTEHHPKLQWLMDAMDLDKGAVRTFAMKDIDRWAFPDLAPKASVAP